MEAYHVYGYSTQLNESLAANSKAYQNHVGSNILDPLMTCN